MSDKKWFVVRRGMTNQHSFEYTTADPAIKKEAARMEYHLPVVYSSIVPEAMTLNKAIQLYKAGVRAKPPKEGERKLKPLAEILRLKRENRKHRMGFTYDSEMYYE